MQTIRVWLLAAAVAVSAVMLMQLPGLLAAPKKSPGSEAYQPTKQEWLALKLQAYYGDNDMNDDGIAVWFEPHPDKPDTVIGRFTYWAENDNFTFKWLESVRDRMKTGFTVMTIGDVRSWAKYEEKLVDLAE